MYQANGSDDLSAPIGIKSIVVTNDIGVDMCHALVAYVVAVKSLIFYNLNEVQSLTLICDC